MTPRGEWIRPSECNNNRHTPTTETLYPVPSKPACPSGSVSGSSTQSDALQLPCLLSLMSFMQLHLCNVPRVRPLLSTSGSVPPTTPGPQPSHQHLLLHCPNPAPAPALVPASCSPVTLHQTAVPVPSLLLLRQPRPLSPRGLRTCSSLCVEGPSHIHPQGSPLRSLLECPLPCEASLTTAPEVAPPPSPPSQPALFFIYSHPIHGVFVHLSVRCLFPTAAGGLQGRVNQAPHTDCSAPGSACLSFPGKYCTS